jgi:hypothetical protein
MNKQQLSVIERAIHSAQDIYPLNQTWATLHEEYNIGLTQGTKLKLSPSDKQELLLLVKQKTGIDLAHKSMADFSILEREEALAIAIDEKFAGQAVKKSRLAIKALPNCALKINQHCYRLPDAAHLDVALETLESVEHDCVLLIENYRCFDKLARIKLSLSAAYSEPLVLFRGDTVYSENTVRQLLQQLQKPVLVMADIDPQGLVIAQSQPFFAGLLMPSLSIIAELLADADKANPQLYAQQLTGCRYALAASPYPLILQLWEMLKQQQAGIVQEHWLNGEIELIAKPI